MTADNIESLLVNANMLVGIDNIKGKMHEMGKSSEHHYNVALYS